MIYRKAGTSTPISPPMLLASSAPHELNYAERNSTTVLASPVVEVISSVVDTDSKADRKAEAESVGGVDKDKDAAPAPVDVEPAQVDSTNTPQEILITPDKSQEEEPGEGGRIEMKREARSLAGCDITQGRWVYDNVSYPLYRTKNCPFADPGFRCEENGRPDKEFMSYHWQPHDCDLPW